MSYRRLVLSGGGIKAIAYVGVFDVFENYGLLNQVDSIIGCSAGAIMALLYVVGYSPKELFQLFTKIDLQSFREFEIESALDKMGIDTGNKFMKLFASMLKQKGFPPEINFQTLFQKTGIDLTIVGSNLTKCKPTYFNVNNNPDMHVLLALRISISFPYIFQPVKYQDDLYIDGGVFEPFPLTYYGEDCPDVLGILLHDRLVNEDRNHKIESMEDKSFAILCGVTDRFIQLVTKGLDDKFLQIDIKNIHSMDFKEGNTIKVEMYNHGKLKAKHFIDKYRKEYLEKFLAEKYLKIWKNKVSNKPTN